MSEEESLKIEECKEATMRSDLECHFPSPSPQPGQTPLRCTSGTNWVHFRRNSVPTLTVSAPPPLHCRTRA